MLLGHNENNHNKQPIAWHGHISFLEKNYTHFTMPTVTWTIAKGIPPRTHLPPKAKKNGCKRNANESSADESERSDSDDVGPKAKAKKHKRQCIIMVDSKEDPESVDDTAEPVREEVKEVNDQNDKPSGTVSTNLQWNGMDSHNLHRRMVLTTINRVKSSKRNLWKKSQCWISSP